MKKLVHTREISMRTSDLGDHYILVEGSLIDHRYRPTQKEGLRGVRACAPYGYSIEGQRSRDVDRTSRGHNASSSEGRMPGDASLDPESGGIGDCPGLQYEGKEGHRWHKRLRTPDEPRHCHGGVRRPGILGRL